MRNVVLLFTSTILDSIFRVSISEQLFVSDKKSYIETEKSRSVYKDSSCTLNPTAHSQLRSCNSFYPGHYAQIKYA